ncbi:UBA-like protein [Cynara cardunculus var. scolymus]|uniref:UBA-like protein n=1 Tax=Cynara cardunculus var. scolymus TaxID=59895 RepID=A0A103XJD9_CYNCS|nr:UBA-like protein [Cynara cardunculus var. scolymus]
MATPNQEAIETFMSITGSSESVAIQKLTEHGGDLNEAVNSHFTEGDRNIRRETSIAAPHEDFMDIDDPSQIASHRPPFSLLPSAREMNPFSILDPNFTRSIFDSGPGFRSAEPFVSHPREVRQIPIEVKDGPSTEPGHSGHAPRIEDVTETAIEGVPETRGHVIIDEDDDDDFLTSRQARWSEREGVHDTQLRASAPLIGEPDYGIEEEMIRAAIEASKQDSEIGQRDDAVPHPMQSQLEDPELAQAVSLSLKVHFLVIIVWCSPCGMFSFLLNIDLFQTAEQEKALRELGSEVGPSEPRISKLVEVEEVETLASSNGRLDVGSSSIQDEAEDAEEQPLWGGISSEEHDEAVMLEAALFGGIPEGTGYRDDEYLASLQADREKELLEQSAREAAMEEERRKEEEALRKLEEEQEMERQLAAKEASLPQEPTSEDENAVTLLVRMPDGSRRGRRFLRTDKLQYLFNFIDVARVVKPGMYRLVRPYPRRAFSDGESNLTLNELGLTSKQEALFLESI